ncbi:hypothetical protein IRJ41_003016 [Triplophysa rosa]|uniref:Gypsy retrotransposon integrase-like protein 1 n=1 Tax=Triplophysa rosa TaxID=992332 RepID=A0A9W7W7T0_TRIRA|nr:hypothetical protein IRJ41_003016 [Triplophysa rosa]
MAQIGRLDEYKPEDEAWSAYIERVELFMIANDVDDAKQVATLLIAVEASTYGLLRNLVQPAEPKDKTFRETVDILQAHYEPKPLVIAERFRFQRCVQKPHETVSQYVAEFKRCASKCNFGATRQRRLLLDDTLTFARALEIIPNLTVARQYHRTAPIKENQVNDLPFIVVEGNGPNLCGRNWLKKVKLNWKVIRYVSQTKQPGSIEEALKKYSEVFEEELGTLKDVKAAISVKNDVPPKFYKSSGIISPVKYTEWAAPVVPVIKKDATIRLCGDYKVTVNQAANTEVYPLPRIEENLATLSGGKWFSKIDLAAAYQQVLLDAESKKYTTINTHKELYVYNRLPFGISSAPSIFQRIMENLLSDLNVIVYLDDLLIVGKDEQEHLTNLCKVLQRLQDSGLRVKRSKCEWEQKRIEYLGHVIDEKGVYPAKDKVRAIQDAPAPSNVKELQAFLGLVNYYGCFVSNQSTLLAPLYRLLKEQVAWQWKEKEQHVFNRCKEQLTGDNVLAHYSAAHLPLTLACDASAYGIGAVLHHTMPNGEEHPIAYASRTLSPAEKKYSQIEKEALSVIYGVKKFHQYLWGRSFSLLRDHRPLVTLLGEHKHFPTMAAARIQRWAIILSAYDYRIIYRKRRKSWKRRWLAITENINVLLINHLQEAHLNTVQIARATRTDQELSRVFCYVMEGWPTEVPENLKLFFAKREELSVEQGCVLWGTRVIVPSKLWKSVMYEIHSGHPGIYVWWPRIDMDIEEVCKECRICQQEQRMPSQVHLRPWEFPGECWKRLQIDFSGPFLNNMFLIVGFPEQIVTDNAITFTSEKFQRFMKCNGILHTTSAPKHPATSGLAERYCGMRKLNYEQMCIDDKISLFLLCYRTTPSCTTFKRYIRTRLDLLKPNIHEAVRKKQYMQKNQHDYRAREQSFAVNDSVFLRSTVGGDPKWLPGVVVQQTGPVSYKVCGPMDTVYRRHGDQLITFLSDTAMHDKKTTQNNASDGMVESDGMVPDCASACGTMLPTLEPQVANPVGLRRSKRTINIPQHFRD